MVGDHVENDNRPQQAGVQEQAVRQCRTVEGVENRNAGYEVTYEYRGHTYTEVMNRDPGDRIRLQVSIMPVRY
jgi:uncharacterized protein YcfJ